MKTSLRTSAERQSCARTKRAWAFAATGLVTLAACGGGGPAAPPVAGPAPSASPTPAPGPPNIVLVLADDLGYGDLSSYGAPLVRTPQLDRLAREGSRFTQLTVAAPLCTPSRAALLTGRHPVRSGLVRNLGSGPPEEGPETGPGSGGLPDAEQTLAEALHELGYATGMVGKWHLGTRRRYMPIHHGFDFYYGLPAGEDTSWMVAGDALTADQVTLDLLTRKYTQEALGFVERERDGHFFLFLSYKAPHVPLEVTPEFRGRSAGGLYGDVVEELDWAVGQVVARLEALDLARRSVVVFLSDNGPWLTQDDAGGSAGPLRGGKGTPWEGGLRVPAIVWAPGRFPAGRVIDEPVTSLDLFPTLLGLAGGRTPTDRRLDGQDLGALLAGSASRLPGPGLEGGRELMAFFDSQAVALRSGRFKCVRTGFWSPGEVGLYDLAADPGEHVNLAASDPEQTARLAARLAELEDEAKAGAPQPQR